MSHSGCCGIKWPWSVLGLYSTLSHNGAAYKMVIEHVSKQELSRYSLCSDLATHVSGAVPLGLSCAPLD